MEHIVWVEGVDFNETVFDSDRLSLIRGASRALEEMPFFVHGMLVKGGLTGIVQFTSAGSMAGFVVRGARDVIDNAVAEITKGLRSQGLNPDSVIPVTEMDDAVLTDHAPFAHLRFHIMVEPVAKGDLNAAIERARAGVRVAQMSDPGLRICYQPLLSAPADKRVCEMDRVRPAECTVEGPADAAPSRPWYVSRASAARWHFGRALRQRLYDDTRVALKKAGRPEYLAFTDDLQEMVAGPRPKINGKALPVSAQRKIAVLVADGDGFTDLRANVCAALGHKAGLVAFNTVLNRSMRGLVNRLAMALADMADDSSSDDKQKAACALFDVTDAEAFPTQLQRKMKISRLHRFETLLFGGDDLTFVVPSWLGWWLALYFFDETTGWAITEADAKAALELCHPGADHAAPLQEFRETALKGGGASFPMRFSAGLAFCSCKTPIRGARKLAHDLCDLAKNSGKGLEIEALESIEPPFDGPAGLRDRILWPGWREKNGDADGASRFCVKREDVVDAYKNLHDLWVAKPHDLCVAKPLPASPAYRAFRAAQDADTCKAEAAHTVLEKYEKVPVKGPSALQRIGKLPGGSLDLQLHFALQQRDYIIAGGDWTKKLYDDILAKRGVKTP